MRKFLFQIALLFIACSLMSNSGCNGFLPVLNGPDNPYECLDGYNNYTGGADLGVIKTKITDTLQYGYILTHSIAGDKYWVVPTPNIISASWNHPLHGIKDRVITYTGTPAAPEKPFVVDNLVCCGHYRVPENDQPHQEWSIFYDCRSTNAFVNNIHMIP